MTEMRAIGILALLAAAFVAGCGGEKAPSEPGMDVPKTNEVEDAMAALNAADRALAEAQKVCPVSDQALGSMGTPIKVDVEGKAVFICCEGCRKKLLRDPKKYLAKLAGAGK